MHKRISIMVLPVILAASLLTIGCGPSSSPPTPSSPTQPSGGTGAAGKTIFASHCAGCHGATGGGGRAPAVIGTGAALGKYNTAQGLFDYVSTTMPANAPGSLSHQEYLDVVSYLLIQDNYLPADTTLVESQLSNISLK